MLYNQNHKKFVITSEPAQEPVALSEVKIAIRVDGSDEDEYITNLMKAARIEAELFTGRAFITQTWDRYLDRIEDRQKDCESLSDYQEGVFAETPPYGKRYISLPKLPIQSVSSFKYYSPSDVESTVATTVYGVDLNNGRVYLKQNQSWPTNLREFDGIKITAVYGYGSSCSDVPEPIRQAIILRVSQMYDNGMSCQMCNTVKAMLMKYKVYNGRI